MYPTPARCRRPSSTTPQVEQLYCTLPAHKGRVTHRLSQLPKAARPLPATAELTPFWWPTPTQPPTGECTPAPGAYAHSTKYFTLPKPYNAFSHEDKYTLLYSPLISYWGSNLIYQINDSQLKHMIMWKHTCTVTNNNLLSSHTSSGHTQHTCRKHCEFRGKA